MKSHTLKLEKATTNAKGETVYHAECALRCWSGILTRSEARRKQDEHVEAESSGRCGAERAGAGIMSAPDIWNDDDGVWLQVGQQTHGPFTSDTEAENANLLIVAGAECSCGECQP